MSQFKLEIIASERQARMERAETIVQQIGRKAMFMLGTRDVLATEKGVRFRVGRNRESVNLVEVILDPDDTYTIKYYRVRGASKKEIAGDKGVYNNQLAKFIGATLGMAVSL